ncbi:unnamed protein product [Phytophthora fragariaefolia]|uniref:Unnamed protein product n=1 Tax=Phytophthora fragariaefolia TaxID=1490495 RepID=A0A9W7D244_9STRA|nr:unnamed protein product [Phytophthora fragariaefolia]
MILAGVFGTLNGLHGSLWCPIRAGFVMTDADKAQYNACVTEIPRTTVLMCWFHVMQNVWKHATQLRLSYADTWKIFTDLYDMQYTPRENGWKHKALLSGRHFTRGYAATNIPLEQYHRRLKLVCSDGKHTPDELIKCLDRARLAVLGQNVEFCNFSSASERLMLLFKLLCKRSRLEVERLPPLPTVPADFYQLGFAFSQSNFAYQGERCSPVVEGSATSHELPLTGSVRDYQSLPTGEPEQAGHHSSTSETALR